MCWALKKCWYRTYQRVLMLGMCLMDWKEPTLIEGEGSVLKLPYIISDSFIIIIYIILTIQ